MTMNYFSAPGIPIEVRTGMSHMPKKPLPPDTIFKIVESATGYSREELMGISRTTPITNVRHLTAYFLMECCNVTLMKAGEILDRDHSTILNSKRVVVDLLSVKEERTMNNYHAIVEAIKEHGRNS